MKKFIKLISCSVVMAALIISTQLCAMAADVTNDNRATSPAVSYPADAVSYPADAENDTVSGVLNDIAPYNNTNNTTGTPNPQTGGQNVVIPGVVAMIAAATAAVTLAGKKK